MLARRYGLATGGGVAPGSRAAALAALGGVSVASGNAGGVVFPPGRSALLRGPAGCIPVYPNSLSMSAWDANLGAWAL